MLRLEKTNTSPPQNRAAQKYLERPLISATSHFPSQIQVVTCFIEKLRVPEVHNLFLFCGEGNKKSAKWIADLFGTMPPRHEDFPFTNLSLGVLESSWLNRKSRMGLPIIDLWANA
jgi:hypothetical protein